MTSYAVSPCVVCGRQMAHCRPQPLPPGMARHAGSGLCCACYSRQWRVAGHGRGGGPSRADRDVDDIAVWRALHGDPIRLNVTERKHAVWACRDHGTSIRETAITLRISSRTVTRIRAQRNTAA